MTVAIFGTPGHVEGAENFDLPEKLKITGDNTGNLLFQYAVAHFVEGEKVFVGRAKRNYSDPVLAGQAKAFLFPAANMFRANADWSGLNRYLQGIKQPLVIFGLGVQAEHGEDTGGLIASLRNNQSVMRMVDIFRNQAGFVGVRGALTAEVAQALGLKNVVVTGCPSLMISDNPNLGRTIASRFKALRDSTEAPRMVVTAAAAQELRGSKLDVERRLLALLHPGDLYIQQSGGASAVSLFAGGEPVEDLWDVKILRKTLFTSPPPEQLKTFLAEHGRVYFSIADWKAETAQAELFLGTRLHGNMLGLQQGIPAALIAHDARTSELITQMHMPRLEMNAFLADPSIAGILKAIEFDDEAFDTERWRAAAIYAEHLPKLGVPVTAKLRALAQ